MGRAAAFLLVAILTAFLILRFASPALFPKTEPAQAAQPQTLRDPIPSRPNPLMPPHSSTIQPANDQMIPRPIDPPRSSERRTYEQTETQRTPFYKLLRDSFQYIIAVRPAPDDQAVLEIYVTADDPYISSELVQKAISPYAAKYGFEKVRFYQPNTLGGADRYRLDAEATADRQGVWNTFRK